VSVNDDWWHQPCSEPPAGHDQPPCQAGQFVCKDGTKFCEGAVGPLPEVCDLKDTDCDGVADTLAACPGNNACVQGVCVEPCRGGEFPCPAGYECSSFSGKKYCVPTTCNAVECPPGASCKDGKCTLDNTGGTSSGGGSGGSAQGGDTPSEAGSGTGNEAGDNGMSSGGSSGSGGGNASGTGGNGNTGNPDLGTKGVYGIVTGGGGCACRTAPSGGGRAAVLVSLLLLGVALGRRRGGREGRAA